MLFCGPLWFGATSLQRCMAFERCEGLEVFRVDRQDQQAVRGKGLGRVYRKVRWRLRWPADPQRERDRLLLEAARVHPDTIFVDNSRVMGASFLKRIRKVSGAQLVFYTPDDVLLSHNRSRQLRSSLASWDAFFTTKTYNVQELERRGVRNLCLVGVAFDPLVHRPMSAREVGEDYERFDAVFVGTYERERSASIACLARTGLKVVIYGARWHGRSMERNVTVRGTAFGIEYARAMHTGKVALNFLRRVNGDLLTTRSVEVPAMGRPMVAEKSREHDQYFEDGCEYLGFGDDAELVSLVHDLVQNRDRRERIARAGAERCREGGYSTDARAQEMLARMGHAEGSPENE